MSIFKIILILFALAFSQPRATAEGSPTYSGVNTQLPRGPKTTPPWGWSDFCHRHPDECIARNLVPKTTRLTPALWTLLNEVNRNVNESVTAITDEEHWGLPERWDFADDGKGDCEDFSLLKRKKLIDAGVPIENLSLAVVRDQSGDGHAVLIVNTDRGALVLDNQVNMIKLWNDTEYRFVKRQSRINPGDWERLDVPDNTSATGH